MNSTVLWSTGKAKGLIQDGIVASVSIYPAINAKGNTVFHIMFLTKYGTTAFLGTSYAKKSNNRKRIFSSFIEAQELIDEKFLIL